MFIIFRYLGRQVLTTMTAVALVLLLIFMSGRFLQYLASAAEGEYAANVIFIVMGYRLPEFLELILPLSFFLGILLTYGRMYQESEMTVLTACGVSERQVLFLTLGPGLLVACLVGAMSLWLTPAGIQQVDRIFAEQAQRTGFEMLAPGRFQEMGSNDRVTYTRAMSDDKQTLEGVFMAEGGDDGRFTLMKAVEGTQIVEGDGERFLVLHEGVRFEGRPGGAEFDAMTFEDYGLRIESPGGVSSGGSREGQSTLALMASDARADQAMVHWRLSLPLLVLVITVLAIPLSRVNPRQGRFFHLLPGILVFISYLGVLILGRDAIASGQVPASAGLWAVHGAFLALGVAMLGWPAMRLRRAAGVRHASD
ncbi:LPS export ABC transporter permease LptF [Halomonas sp. 22501_18_FS]|uniref:Lipopolysaccharide export system permease protein LptF n=1 Tax=Vreelandella halophila TaxID=86177 RepID=A0A9X4YA46_9GAMM|nr:LPS export ABC transporter permease LptF [Halomonas utahensis]MYL76029.1 LPS export ABC transporter permease LptF [Halomonas sp. 22501_18_FS]